jgi:hypothetical protein
VEGFSGWDWVLLVVAGYVAVTAMVQLMLRRRNEVVEELHRRVQAEQQSQADRVAARRQRSA